MTTKQKLYYLACFPDIDSDTAYRMKCKGRDAANFTVFLAPNEGGALYVRCFHRYYTGELVERQRYVFAPEGAVRYGNDDFGWKVRRELREPVFCKACYGYSFDNRYMVLGTENIRRSCMRYSCFDKYNGNNFIEYLALYCKHKNLEYLMKSGYGDYAFDEICTGYWGGIEHIKPSAQINWRSNNLLKMLGLTRTEFKALKGSEELYEHFLSWRPLCPRNTPEEIVFIARLLGEDTDIARSLKHSHLTPLRLARYLDDHGISGSDYGDYAVECLELGLDMRDTAISMPNDFMKVHTRFSMIVEYKIDALHIARFDKRLAERAVLEFSSDDLIVRQPLSMEEIVYEGKVLGHCVGGYAERHANGVLHILFIRSRDKPDKPFYTMELSTDGKIMQVRGLKNADPTREVKVLISAYKEYLKTIFTNHRRKTA